MVQSLAVWNQRVLGPHPRSGTSMVGGPRESFHRAGAAAVFPAGMGAGPPLL